jgi:hypothetical protein
MPKALACGFYKQAADLLLLLLHATSTVTQGEPLLS